MCPAKGKKCQNYEKYQQLSKVCRVQGKSDYDEPKAYLIANSEEKQSTLALMMKLFKQLPNITNPMQDPNQKQPSVLENPRLASLKS